MLETAKTAKLPKSEFKQLCSACEAGGCSVGLWPPWTFWGLRISCNWVERQWPQKCLCCHQVLCCHPHVCCHPLCCHPLVCCHPLAADDGKSQTSSCLLAPVKSNRSLLCLWKLCPGVNFCLFLVRFTLFFIPVSDMKHWVNTLHSSSLRYPGTNLRHLKTNIWGIANIILLSLALIFFTSSESVLSLWWPTMTGELPNQHLLIVMKTSLPSFAKFISNTHFYSFDLHFFFLFHCKYMLTSVDNFIFRRIGSSDPIGRVECGYNRKGELSADINKNQEIDWAKVWLINQNMWLMSR